ncbi:MAG: CapA family protein [Firmicutes bacterium]|nr:CapA family protein [Bacillota bacterium]
MRKPLVFGAVLSILSAVIFFISFAEEGPPPAAEPRVLLAAVGDIYLGGGLGERIRREGPDYPWRGTIEVLRQADLRVGNLESVLSRAGRVYVPKQYTLRAEPEAVAALTSGGFNVVSLANNHAMDYGWSPLAETIQLLDREGIAHCGAGINLAAARAPASLTVNGLRLAFLAYSLTYPTEFYATSSRPGTAPGYEAYLRADIPAAKEKADLVVVCFHWSGEGVNYPRDYQRRLARLAIDLGASLVLGHHPHVLQGFEVYHGGLIAYSLGNFAFGSYAARAKDSVILLVELDRGGPLTAWVYPVNVYTREVAFQTRLRKGEDAIRVLADLQRYSVAFGLSLRREGERGVIAIRP